MRILLVCTAGTSTTLLANNLRTEAIARDMEVSVEALQIGDLSEAQWRRAHVVLIGPELRYQLEEIAATGAHYHVPVAAIPAQDYASANADHVLEQAQTLVQNQEFYRDDGLKYHPE